MSASLKTPVLFLIFNRPDTTAEVFEAIRKARPEKLFVAADGPRAHKEGEAEKCAETRAIVDSVDWPCQVTKLYREDNLGCKKAVSGGITWFFEQVEEGIILEDDCLPSASFFSFCEAMLKKYRNNENIMHITGDGMAEGMSYGDGSYFYSPFSMIWGWATWRRAWKHYDVAMAHYPSFKQKNIIADIFPEENYQKMWTDKFDEIYSGKIDTWDYQWGFALLANRGLGIIPNTNLITNIGFREDATHTTVDSHLAMKPSKEMDEIVPPEFMIPNRAGIAWIMLNSHFTKAYDRPIEKMNAYQLLRNLYGQFRNAIGLNR